MVGVGVGIGVEGEVGPVGVGVGLGLRLWVGVGDSVGLSWFFGNLLWFEEFTWVWFWVEFEVGF